MNLDMIHVGISVVDIMVQLKWWWDVWYLVPLGAMPINTAKASVRSDIETIQHETLPVRLPGA